MAIEPVYTISSKASGGGRDGEVVSASGQIDLDLRMPKEMGGSGEGTNPEELFSAGYAACFLGALRATSKQAGNPVPDESTVKVTVGIGKDPSDGGFGDPGTGGDTGGDPGTGGDTGGGDDGSLEDGGGFDGGGDPFEDGSSGPF